MLSAHSSRSRGKSSRPSCPRAWGAAAPPSAKANFYRTATGHELDLVIELSASRRWVFEFKKSLTPHLEKGFHIACEDVKPERRLLVYPGSEAFSMSGKVEVLPLVEATRAVASA